MKLELRGIAERFGPLITNDHINLNIEEGCIHTLLGENGADKSTLVNALYGLHQPDEGEILIDDKPVVFRGSGDAVAAGIGMVHQHFMLIPVFTVVESIALGDESTGKAGFTGIAKARQIVHGVSARFGFDLDPDAKTEDLPVGAQQCVEIVKALSREAKVLILDKPAAVLTPQETDELMTVMCQLTDSGTSIVFITHKLREVRTVSDDITVIRRGAVVGTASPQDSENELANKMIGRAIMFKVEKEEAKPTGGGLVFDPVSMFAPLGNVILDRVSFSIEQDEIFAIADVQGNGQTELAEVILGLVNLGSGSIALEGIDITHANLRKSLESGIGFVPEDHSKDGIIASFSIAENLVPDQYNRALFFAGPMFKLGAIVKNTEDLHEEYDIRLARIRDPIFSPSGGNQQKVVVAREMSKELKLLVVNQPTCGVGAGSIEFIHKQIVAMRDKGAPVLLISSELDEVVALADRIAVMHRGRITGIVPATTPHEVLDLMVARVSLEKAFTSGSNAEKEGR